MTAKQEQLLAIELILEINRAILFYGKTRGICCDELTICLPRSVRGKTELSVTFELERFTEEGYGYTNIEGRLNLSRKDKTAEWRRGAVNGTAEEVGEGNAKVTDGSFTVQGEYKRGKGLVVEVFPAKNPKLIAEFAV